MIRTILTALLLTICAFSYSQDEFNYTRDFESILNQTSDSTSAFYYPKLLQRFHLNDSTLTDKEVLAMMIAFTKNENYKPYPTIDKEREILKLIEEKEYIKALYKCNNLLVTSPFNLAALMEKGFALWKLDGENVEFHKSQYFKVLDAVLSSGDGSKNNAFFVLSPIDGQILIRYVWQGKIGTMGSGSDENGNFVDILEMQREGKEAIDVYFNIEHAKMKFD